MQQISILIENVGKSFKKNFEVKNEHLNPKYEQVFKIFQKCHDVNSNEHKGILLYGGLGLGKSMLMRVFQRMLVGTKREFKWVSGSTLKDIIEQEGLSKVKEYYGKNLTMDLYIDDIGFVNSEYNKFGNVSNILAELIFERYELFVNLGIKTHFSANASVADLQKLLTIRAFDRLVEMCEFIAFTGKSMRK